MVWDEISDDVELVVMGCGDKCFDIIECAKMRVDLVEISDVVSVIG